MTRFKDFDAARAEQNAEPLEFKLGGEDFTASGIVPAGIILDLGRAVAEGNDLGSFGLFTELFESIVPEADQQRFAAAVRLVGLDVVLELVQWIMEESTGRPLPKGSNLPVAPSPDGPPSRVVSLSPVSEARSA